MIIGNGLLSNVFNQYKNNSDILIFASGVSNSHETGKNEFLREKELLLDTIKNNTTKIIIYFSSCDVIYANKINIAYYYHKLEMEKLIKENVAKYYIFRLPQVIGQSSNNNSLINYFITSIKEQQEIQIWEKAYKNLIDVQDVLVLVNNIINNEMYLNKITNIINKNYYSIVEIIKTVEKLLNLKAKIKLIDKGFKPNYTIDYIENLGVTFNDDYLKKSLSTNYKDIIHK